MFELVIKALKAPENRPAWIVAAAADFIQIIAFPFFFGGVLSPADDVLDVITGAILIKLLGWHWAFLPSFFAELVPGLDLFPTWTAAVLFITGQRASSESSSSAHLDSSEPKILPPSPNQTPVRRP